MGSIMVNLIFVFTTGPVGTVMKYICIIKPYAKNISDQTFLAEILRSAHNSPWMWYNVKLKCLKIDLLC